MKKPVAVRLDGSIRYLVVATLVASSTRLLAQSDAMPDHVSSKLMIHVPHRLFKESAYDHREAMFGRPPYGKSISQNVYYADSYMCTNEKNSTLKKAWELPFILLVNRGGDCSSVRKVRNAQHAGASAVLIADDGCQCSDRTCVDASGSDSCRNDEPFLYDDGSGADVSIPSFLMFKLDADQVKAELVQNRPVQIEMSWTLPTRNDRVAYNLWTVPKDPVGWEFLATFQPLAVALGDRAYFTPHEYLLDGDADPHGTRSFCRDHNGENYCYHVCTNNGRYCAAGPNQDLEPIFSGPDVIRESLRRLCVWDIYGASNGIGVQWWEYVAEFQKRCNSPDIFANQDCIDHVYQSAGVDGALVAQCMTDSGGVDADIANVKLDQQIQLQSQRGVVVAPTISVNGAIVRGSLSAANVFSAICAGFRDGTAPDVCQRCAHCDDAVACVEQGSSCPTSLGGAPGHGAPNNGASVQAVVCLVAVCGAVVAAMGALMTRDGLRDRVRNILTKSLPLEDQANDVSVRADPMDMTRDEADTVKLLS